MGGNHPMKKTDKKKMQDAAKWAEANTKIALLEIKLKSVRNSWIEEAQKAAGLLSANMENHQLKRRLELAELIVSSKQVEALACLFRKDTCVFTMDIRMDSSAHEQARKEIAEKAIAEHELSKIKRGNWSTKWEGKKLVATWEVAAEKEGA